MRATGGSEPDAKAPGGAAPALSRAPFAHTPYDGSARPFSVGLAPLDLADWIEIDGHLVDQLARKAALLAGAGAPVLAAEPGTEAAQREVLDLIAAHLPARFPDLYRAAQGRIALPAAGIAIDLADPGEPPIAAAARLVQEDLVLMRKGPSGYRLAAAALCFPSSWSLVEKFGQDMTAIHAGVPGFNDTRMGAMVARIFDNLAVDRPSWRLNWSLYAGAELHHPRPKRIDPDRLAGPGAQAAAAGREVGTEAGGETGDAQGLHVRVERQTLRRLPASGDILFTIRVHHDPVAAFPRHPRGRALAAGLRDQLLALDAAQAAYKGLGEPLRARIAALLEALARDCGHDAP